MELPKVFERVKAAFIDSVILILLIMLISDIFISFNDVNVVYRIIAFIAIFILYEPLLVSFVGGTIGHKFTGLRIKRAVDEDKNLPFHLALIRFIIKIFLGWISLLTITGNKNRQAIHDMFVKSIVVYETK